ncbi:hypothetical protein PGB90_009740 [Kerria lacca]
MSFRSPYCNSVRELSEYLINETSPTTLPAKLLVIKIKELLKSKLSCLESNNVAASIATILDPHYKKINFQSLIACAKAVTRIKKLLPATDPSNPQSDDTSLNLIAEDFLLVPGSLTPIGRMFSLCGIIAHAKQNRLSSENLNAILFLHSASVDL